jgi:ABC-type uncharacterized transport system permease subunit
MLSGVTILCFAASYVIVLALEFSRLVFRSGVRGAVMIGWAAAGLLAHSAFLYHRAVSTGDVPLSSNRDWYLLAAWVLMVVYLYLVCYHPKTHFGLFLMPLVLGLIATAQFLADAQPFAREPASKVWGAIHGTAILLATVSVLVGFAAGLMYLRQSRRLKAKHPPTFGLRLPSLEWLQRANSRAIVVSLVMLIIGVAAGMVLNLINSRHQVRMLPLSDPVVFSTVLLTLWLLAASLFSAFYRPARQGHKVAYLTVVSFIFLLLVLALVTGVVWKTEHGVGGEECKLQIENCKLKIEDGCNLIPTVYGEHSPKFAICNGGPA